MLNQCSSRGWKSRGRLSVWPSGARLGSDETAEELLIHFPGLSQQSEDGQHQRIVHHSPRNWKKKTEQKSILLQYKQKTKEIEIL